MDFFWPLAVTRWMHLGSLLMLFGACLFVLPEAIAELARLATRAESEAARVAAIKELLDRGYGRAVQPIEGSMTYGVSEQLAEMFRENFADYADGLDPEIAAAGPGGSPR